MLVWSLTLYLIDEPMALLYSNLHHYTDITEKSTENEGKTGEAELMALKIQLSPGFHNTMDCMLPETRGWNGGTYILYRERKEK